jgi:hypothetical protein
VSAAERLAGQLDVDEVLALVQPEPSSPAVGGSGAVVGELVGDGELGVVAAEVAARQRSPQTRRAYAGAYRAFCVSLGPSPTRDAFTAAAVRAYRDRLEAAGRAPATIACISPRCGAWPSSSARMRGSPRSGPSACRAASRGR